MNHRRFLGKERERPTIQDGSIAKQPVYSTHVYRDSTTFSLTHAHSYTRTYTHTHTDERSARLNSMYKNVLGNVGVVSAPLGYS